MYNSIYDDYDDDDDDDYDYDDDDDDYKPSGKSSFTNKCGNCYCYIDGDAMYCMDCLEDALGGSGSNSGSSYGNECYICGDSAYSKYGSYYYCSDCLDLVKKFSD